jgi:hypothetical protein
VSPSNTGVMMSALRTSTALIRNAMSQKDVRLITSGTEREHKHPPLMPRHMPCADLAALLE